MWSFPVNLTSFVLDRHKFVKNIQSKEFHSYCNQYVNFNVQLKIPLGQHLHSRTVVHMEKQ